MVARDSTCAEFTALDNSTNSPTGVSDEQATKLDKKSMKQLTKFSKTGIAQLEKSDGKDLAGDTVVQGLARAREVLRDELARARVKTKEKRRHMWDFTHLRLEMWDATWEQLYTAYLRWARKSDDDSEEGVYNVSKAVRRLEALARWWHDHGDEVALDQVEDLKAYSRNLYDLFGVHISADRDERLGTVMFSLDLGPFIAYEGKPDNQEMLRFSAWLCMALTLDEDIQVHGVSIVEDCRFMPLVKMTSKVDMKTKEKSDALMQGASAVKIKKIVVAQAPWWMRWMATLFRVFLSKKLKERMVVAGAEYIEPIDDIYNPRDLPQGFLHGTGSSSDRFYPDWQPYHTRPHYGLGDAA